MSTVWDCCREIEQRLADIDEARLEARELTARAAGLDARKTERWRRTELTPEAERAARELLRRRLAGEPLAYLLGEWDFYGYTFSVSPAALIPRPETEWLCDAAVREAKALPEPRVLDLCCGSGCIGLALALAVPAARVTAVDCSPEALALTRANARRHGLKAPRFAALVGDALRPESIAGEFDIVVSNPPYVTAREMRELDSSVADYEPSLALFGGEDGLDFYRAIARRPAFRLRKGGALLLECGWKQGEAVCGLLRESGWHDVCIKEDLAGIPRIVCAKK